MEDKTHKSEYSYFCPKCEDKIPINKFGSNEQVLLDNYKRCEKCDVRMDVTCKTIIFQSYEVGGECKLYEK